MVRVTSWFFLCASCLIMRRLAWQTAWTSTVFMSPSIPSMSTSGRDASVLLRLKEDYDGAEPVNVGIGNEIRIAELARLIASLVGYEGRLAFDPSQPDGQPRRSLDTRRARELFGFQARVGIREGLRRTIDWYLGHQRG